MEPDEECLTITANYLSSGLYPENCSLTVKRAIYEEERYEGPRRKEDRPVIISNLVAQTHKIKSLHEGLGGKTIMASSLDLKGVDEKFFYCSICFSYLREPKLLPCLHRYCKRCLEANMEKHNNVLICNLCSYECAIPPGGIDGFKTDYHMESLLEFKKIKFSFENKIARECIGCSKKSEISAAYCFKCKDFLCYNCYQFHLQNRMVADHQTKLLSAQFFESDSFDLQKYSLLKEPPKCSVHPQSLAQQCCTTCVNVPLCSVCVSVDHNGHNLYEVKAFSDSEKLQVLSLFGQISDCEKKFDVLVQGIAGANDLINNIAASDDSKLVRQYEEGCSDIKGKVKKCIETLHTSKTAVAASIRVQQESLRKEKEEELRVVNEKYVTKLRKIQETANAKRGALDKKYENDIRGLNDKQLRLEKKMTSDKELVKQKQQQQTVKVKQLSDSSGQMALRINNITATIKIIQAFSNDWTATQCLPEMLSAAKILIEDVDGKCAQLRSLLDGPPDCQGVSVGKHVKTTADRPTTSSADEYSEKTVVEIKEMKDTKQKIHDIAGCGKNRVVITGYDSKQYSFLSFIDSKGKQLKSFKTQEKNALPFRYCSFFADSKVVTVSKFNLICIFDSQDTFFQEKNISDIVPGWNSSVRLTCVATDPTTCDIYVGASNLKIYVFDERLLLIKTLDLSNTIKSMIDMVVLEDELLVCDQTEKAAYIITKRNPDIQINHRIESPFLGGDESCPLSVCRNLQGLIFVLWPSTCSGQSGRICATYRKDGRKLLDARTVDRRADLITTMKASHGQEKLVGASGRSNKLFMYVLSKKTSHKETKSSKDSRAAKRSYSSVSQ